MLMSLQRGVTGNTSISAQFRRIAPSGDAEAPFPYNRNCVRATFVGIQPRPFRADLGKTLGRRHAV